MSLNEYYDEIRNDIAIEFGFEAVGFGSNKLDTNSARYYLEKFNELSADEQNALLASRGYYVTKNDLFDQDDLAID